MVLLNGTVLIIIIANLNEYNIVKNISLRKDHKQTTFNANHKTNNLSNTERLFTILEIEC